MLAEELLGIDGCGRESLFLWASSPGSSPMLQWMAPTQAFIGLSGLLKKKEEDIRLGRRTGQGM